mgnify:CR=1 FL=1
MRKVALTAVAGMMVLAVSRLWATGAEPPVVYLDLETMRATAEAPVVITAQPATRGIEYRFGFRNDAEDEITSLLKVSGLKLNDFDIYLSGAFMGSFSTSDLIAGIPIPMGKGALPYPDRIRLETLTRNFEYAWSQMQSDRGRDKNWPYWPEFQGILRWCNSIQSGDQRLRTANIVLLLSGRATRSTPRARPLPAEEIQSLSKSLFEDVERFRSIVRGNDPVKLETAQREKYLLWLSGLSVRVTGVPTRTRVELEITNDGGEPFKGAIATADPTSMPVDFEVKANDKAKVVVNLLTEADLKPKEARVLLRGTYGADKVNGLLPLILN